MFVPILPAEKMVGDDGFVTKPWETYFEQLQQNMQQALSDEGFLIPSVSSQVIPPATISNVQVVQNSFGRPNGILAGTLIFDPYEINGATLPARNGKLKILLNDGTFHPITNT